MICSDAVITICGSGLGVRQGKCLGGAAFSSPACICPDPVNPENYWVGDASSIRYCTATAVTLVAGSTKPGVTDGIGTAASFNVVWGLLCTSNGDRLFVSDFHNHLIRSVDTKTRAVTTIVGDGHGVSTDGIGTQCSICEPRKLVFDRSPKSKPQSVIFITSRHAIRRMEVATGLVTTLPLKVDVKSTYFCPYGIGVTPTGHLIVTCTLTASIYVFDPETGDYEVLCSSRIHFREPDDVAVVDSERSAFVVDSILRNLRQITLPPRLFASE